MLEILAAGNHLKRAATLSGWCVIQAFKIGPHVDVQLNSADGVLVSRVDDPEVV